MAQKSADEVHPGLGGAGATAPVNGRNCRYAIPGWRGVNVNFATPSTTGTTPETGTFVRFRTHCCAGSLSR